MKSVANIKSAKKRIKVIETKTARNKAIKSKVKTDVKRLVAAVEANDKATADKQLEVVIKAIDKAQSKGIFKKNTASRRISRLTKSVNKMA